MSNVVVNGPEIGYGAPDPGEQLIVEREVYDPDEYAEVLRDRLLRLDFGEDTNPVEFLQLLGSIASHIDGIAKAHGIYDPVLGKTNISRANVMTDEQRQRLVKEIFVGSFAHRIMAGLLPKTKKNKQLTKNGQF